MRTPWLILLLVPLWLAVLLSVAWAMWRRRSTDGLRSAARWRAGRIALDRVSQSYPRGETLAARVATPSDEAYDYSP